MRCFLASLLCLAPAAGLACDDPASPLYRFNPDAIVEQPAPSLITGATATASLSPTIAGGCFDDSCPDASAATFTITTMEPGNFGYELELIDPPASAPFLQGAAFAAPNTTGTAEVTILWSSDDQHQGEPFVVRIRTVNLKGDVSAWSDPVTVVPTPLAGRSGGIGLGWLSLLLLLGLRGRKRIFKA